MTSSDTTAHMRWPLIRWFASSATLNIPQAAGPVAFSLMALSLTGDPSHGAAIMVAMMLAQVVGAVPVTRLGKRYPTASFLRFLLCVRTAALAGMTVLAFYQAAFGWLIAIAAIGGSVNGAAFGYLRSLLNALTPTSGLPRALGISATLNEMTFVLAPVVASGLGAHSPNLAVAAVALLGSVPIFLIPNVGPVHLPDAPQISGSVWSPAIGVWLTCAAAGGAAVAAIEIGAVTLAIRFGYEPALAIIFTVPLCLASVAGGVFVSVRNRKSARNTVLAQLIVMLTGMSIVACQFSEFSTIGGAILIGCVLAPLATHYSLTLDELAPVERRAELFAILRTAHSIGIISAGIALTALPLTAALAAVTSLMIVATTLAWVEPSLGRNPSKTRND